MKLLQTMGIGGHVVGLGKITADGQTIYNEIEPVHNIIVDTGFATLLQRNFDNVTATFWNDNLPVENLLLGVSRGGSYGRTYTPRCGSLYYCAYGDGNSPTEYTTTALEHKVSPYIAWDENSATSTGSLPNRRGMTGMQRLSDNSLRNRVTYIFNAATVAATIKEIGIFQREIDHTNYYDDRTSNNGKWLDNYRMFARVVLPEPYDIAVGEKFIVSYELGIKFPDVAHNLDSGLVDGTGAPIRYSRKYVVRSANATNPFEGWSSYPYAAYNGGQVNGNIDNTNVVQSSQMLLPIWAFDMDRHSKQFFMPAYSATDKGFPSTWGDESGLTHPGDTTTIIQMGTYNAETQSRAARITLASSWPNNMTTTGSVDIHYLLFNGVAYRFGYYDEGHEGESDYWHPQAIHKEGTQTLSFTLTQKFERI